jgi:putative ABC transport system ATP-binding protein
MTETQSTGTVASEGRNVTKDFGSGDTLVRALDSVSIEFKNGAFSAIMGPSGSGKSTLLHCLAGLEHTTSGDVLIGGREITRMRDGELTQIRRDHVGFIFQSFNLVPTLTALDNIVLPARLAGREVDQEWLNRVIDAVSIADRLQHRPSELSGGQQQRVAAARAFVTRPDVVFADEPTGNLDSKSGHDLLDFMRRAVDELQQTIVMVTHDPNGASYADRVVFLGDGKIVDEVSDPTADMIIDRLKLFGS